MNERPKIINYKAINGEGAYDYVSDVNKHFDQLDKEKKALQAIIEKGFSPLEIKDIENVNKFKALIATQQKEIDQLEEEKKDHSKALKLSLIHI